MRTRGIGDLVEGWEAAGALASPIEKKIQADATCNQYAIAGCFWGD